jgi:hypothetical protein
MHGSSQVGQPRTKTFTKRNTDTTRDITLLILKAKRISATAACPAMLPLDMMLFMVTRDRIRSGRSSKSVARKTKWLTKTRSSSRSSLLSNAIQQQHKSRHSTMKLMPVPTTLSQNHQSAK